jgi:hypothetical protein
MDIAEGGCLPVILNFVRKGDRLETLKATDLLTMLADQTRILKAALAIDTLLMNLLIERVASPRVQLDIKVASISVVARFAMRMSYHVMHFMRYVRYIPWCG